MGAMVVDLAQAVASPAAPWVVLGVMFASLVLATGKAKKKAASGGGQ